MAAKNRIAFVANTSWSIYKFRLYLIKQLIDQGFSLFVLAPRDSYTARFEDLRGLTYIELTKFKGKKISPWQDIRLYRELLKHYRQIRPGLIFHYTIKANIAGSLAAARIRVPTVSVVTGLGYAFSGGRLLTSAVKIFYRPALRKNTEVWFLNPDDRQVFLREKLVAEEKTFLLPGEGVDTEAFYPMPYEESKDPLTFLLVGRMIKHKGIYEFIRAAEQLKRKGLPLRFQLLGFFDKGNPVAISKSEIEKWTHRNLITYLGHTDDVAPFIGQADCIVLPSYHEGMPLSLLEGASMCKALIASDTAGCREVITSGVNGYLCRPRDPEDLANQMEKYFLLPAAEKRQMGIEGRNKVLSSFTKEIITGIYLGKIRKLLG
jgi:glycosyltransferase involved in cell wall biosynthesis